MCGIIQVTAEQFRRGGLGIECRGGGAALTQLAQTRPKRIPRCVPISREFAAELAQLRPLHARALGRAVGDADRVFLSPEGQPHREDTTNARRVFRRLLEAAGIERIDALGRKLDIHALRGSAATSLARRGVSMAVTQRLLGHKTVEMTAKHYTRLEVEDVRAAIEGRAGPGAAREVMG
jgi:integrase